MKRYELLKDLPFAKAGEICEINRGGINDYITLYRNEEQIHKFKVGDNASEMFDEWFEEVEELKRYYFIGGLGYIGSDTVDGSTEKYRQELCNYFETQEEAEKYRGYLKAKSIIKQDTKGFKPDWKDIAEDKYYGFWDSSAKKLDWIRISILQDDRIYFETKNDIKESFEKHPEEWKTYLTYEQQ